MTHRDRPSLPDAHSFGTRTRAKARAYGRSTAHAVHISTAPAVPILTAHEVPAIPGPQYQARPFIRASPFIRANSRSVPLFDELVEAKHGSPRTPQRSRARQAAREGGVWVFEKPTRGWQPPRSKAARVGQISTPATGSLFHACWQTLCNQNRDYQTQSKHQRHSNTHPEKFRCKLNSRRRIHNIRVLAFKCDSCGR